MASSYRFELFSHRVVGDRREMNDGVDAVQKIRREIADIAEMQSVKQAFRQPRGASQIVSEIAAVETDQLRAGEACAQMADQYGPDIAHRAGDQNAHDGFGPIYHFFQGALPLAQRSSR